MTVKTIEKKVTELERRLRAIELGLMVPQRVSQKPDPVWEQTRGTISKAKARKMLKSIKELRANSDRTYKESFVRRIKEAVEHKADRTFKDKESFLAEFN